MSIDRIDRPNDRGERGSLSIELCGFCSNYRTIYHGVHRLLIAKFSDSEPVVEHEAGGVFLTIDGAHHELSRRTAAALAADLGEVLAGCDEFVLTIGERRPDGSYVVSRRSADSAGHRTVFDGPEISGGRRRLLVRFLAEHSAFVCELVSRQPLAARKRDRRGGNGNG